MPDNFLNPEPCALKYPPTLFRLKQPESAEPDENINAAGFAVQYDPNHGRRLPSHLDGKRHPVLSEPSRLACKLKAKV